MRRAAGHCFFRWTATDEYRQDSGLDSQTVTIAKNRK
jgi:hypothetical protein